MRLFAVEVMVVGDFSRSASGVSVWLDDDVVVVDEVARVEVDSWRALGGGAGC
jgi:hypothetical protein